MAKPKASNNKGSGVKVPAEWNARMMTSAKPKPRAGTIPAKPKVATKPSAQVTPTKTGVKVPAEWNARMMTSAKPKPRTGTIPAPSKPAAKPNNSAATPINQTTATPPAKPAATPTPRSTANYGPPSSQVKFQGAPKAGNFNGNVRRFIQGTKLLTNASTLAVGMGAGELLGKAGIAFRQNSPLDSKNDSARRRADPRYQPLRQMSAAEMRNAPKLQQYNPDSSASKPAAKTASKPAAKPASAPARMSAPAARSSSAPTVRNPTPQRTPAMVPQFKNMDENYTTWAKANKVLAEKVKPGQVGYDTIQKALGKTSSDTPAAKPTPKNGSSSGTEQAIRSIESDPKAKPFNTDKVPTKSETDKLKDLQALRIAKRKAGVA